MVTAYMNMYGMTVMRYFFPATDTNHNFGQNL